MFPPGLEPETLVIKSFRQHFHETNTCMSSLINDSDPIIRRLVVPIISKCAAIGGFDSDSIEKRFQLDIFKAGLSLDIFTFFLKT